MAAAPASVSLSGFMETLNEDGPPVWTAAVELELAKGETGDLTFAAGHQIVSVTDRRGNIRRVLARFSLWFARVCKLPPLESDAASLRICQVLESIEAGGWVM
ncbi:hypothetical protein [Schlesneria sp. DSM 10557]|uniref:hypothetical protein n=1 Tax=Schlesneria sp. DSM 10557 TaxID=3044399 RepID=UPI0035A08980